jgi:hypothetical protein
MSTKWVYDVLIIDLDLPGEGEENGYDACKKVKMIYDR